MPVVRNLAQRYEKFRAKTAPDRVGTRYENSKAIALERYLEGIASPVTIREQARAVLDSMGVPAGQWALYLSFVQHIASKVKKYHDASLNAFLNGAKQSWVIRGADPEVLNHLIALVTGAVKSR